MSENTPWFGSLKEVMENIAAREQYSPTEMTRLARQIPSLHPQVRQSFLTWLSTGVVDQSIEVQGYTLEKLMSLHGRKAVAASYLILAELLKDLDMRQTSQVGAQDDWVRWSNEKPK